MGRNHSFILLAWLALSVPAAAENSAVCDDLRGRIADIVETVGTSHELRQYQSAIVEQTFEIRKASNDLRDNQCSSGSVVVIDGSDEGACSQIADSLQSMQRNLRDLTAKRDQLRHDNGADGATRDQLAKALHANGCDDPTLDDRDTIISNRPDTPLAADPAYPDTAAVTPLDQSGGPSGEAQAPQSPIQTYAYGQSYAGTVRTVCVRTCDGGFFPMTPNASASDFERDGETCAKMCPGVKTELFFHKLPSQETSAMVSAISGVPYSAMPYAFVFRKRQPNEKTSCTCNLPAYYEQMRRENALSQPQAPGAAQSAIITIAPKTPAPVAAAPSETEPPPPERPYDPSAAKVRQVGPQFLSSDPGKLDLTHPAAPGNPAQQQ